MLVYCIWNGLLLLSSSTTCNGNIFNHTQIPHIIYIYKETRVQALIARILEKTYLGEDGVDIYTIIFTENPDHILHKFTEI